MKMNGQDTCHKGTFTPIYILNNPSLLPDTPCTSGFRGVPYWYPTSTEMLVGFLEPCTNYLVPDTATITGAIQTPQASLYPIVPQPVPDGNGVLAVSDYGLIPGSMNVNPDYKSFAATCLTSPLRKDSLYRLDFYAGFGTAGNEYLTANGVLLGPQTSPSPETFAIYGMGDCSAVGNPIPLYSCIERAGWTTLGTVSVKGEPGAWVKASILFTPPMDIQAIALGPSCDTNFTTASVANTHNGQTYDVNRFSFFMDSLQFYGTSIPPPLVTIVSGDSCTPTVVLEMQPATYYAASSLQWYRNDTLLAGQQDSTITIPRKNSGSDLYRCQVQNDSACLVSNPFPVDWTPLPNSSVLGAPDTSICQTDSILLNAFTDSIFHYLWQDGSTRSFFSVTQNGTYTVSISDACGTAQAQKTVQFVKCDYDVYVPNAFTPNNDGKNDLFQTRFFHPPARFDLRIFNRNGLELFSTNDATQGWDGNYEGIRQPAGAYIWALRYTDETHKDHSLTGTLVLIR